MDKEKKAYLCIPFEIKHRKMHRILFFLFVILLLPTTIQGKDKYPGPKLYVYRYYLYNKIGSKYTLDRPSKYLSQKSIERRKRQKLKIDSTDLPIPEEQLMRFNVKGAKIMGKSKWNNTVIVGSADTTLLNLLAQLPNVKKAKKVFQSPDSINFTLANHKRIIQDHFNRWDSVHNDPLGVSRPQIEMLAGNRLHETELYGKGMTIAVLDGGFQNVDKLNCFSQLRLAGTNDFVSVAKDYTADYDFFDGIDHGTKVLSAMAAVAPEVIMGTAPDADYWLLRCEDPLTEMPIEEDYWAMAAEFADSVGVDIINSSLGYNEFDNHFGDYHLRDLDGHTALISHTASLLANKGIILCNSAGNSGMGPWKKITAPADADNIITVGAVNAECKNAPFASVGPTHDGRIKPDVVAMGSGTVLVSGRGALVRDMGTSFSTPIVTGLVACLWQGLPKKSAIEIIELVRNCGSQVDEPDNILGYGIPDFWKAYIIGRMTNDK